MTIGVINWSTNLNKKSKPNLTCLVRFWSTVFTLFLVSFHSSLIRLPFVLLHCPSISIPRLLILLLIALCSQQHFLLSIFLFPRQLRSTYSPTLTCSMPHEMWFPCIHFTLILILFLHFLSLGWVSRHFSVSLAFFFYLSYLLTIWSNSFISSLFHQPALTLRIFTFHPHQGQWLPSIHQEQWALPVSSSFRVRILSMHILAFHSMLQYCDLYWKWFHWGL